MGLRKTWAMTSDEVTESGMDKKSDTEGVPGPAIDASMTARHWWREDGSMLLPGEKGGSTVFEISFWDGCRYVGHTETTVFEYADDLVASPWDERRSRFVAEHCARMGSVVRCIASGLEVVAAAELRDELVANGPDGLGKVDKASLEARDCFLAEVPVEPVRMSFADWVKTREEGEPRGEC